MKNPATKKQWQRYKELELISDESRQLQSCLTASSTANQPQRTSWLQAIWNAIDLALLRSLEPRVWQKLDPDGKSRWYLYDPTTGSTRRLSSDAEVCRWLEQIFRY